MKYAPTDSEPAVEVYSRPPALPQTPPVLTVPSDLWLPAESILSYKASAAKPQTVYEIDPIADPRWRDLVLRHPCGSVFHSPEWLQSLRRTYGYEPVAVTTAPPGSQLTNGIVFCRVTSWVTGRRMVSLPFADHCDPLVKSEEEIQGLISEIKLQSDRGQWDYLELRPRLWPLAWNGGFGKTAAFWAHWVDVRLPIDELYRGLHKNCIQRKIRRAQQASLAYEEGHSERLLVQFYDLLVMTRRRQHLPPQPYTWFRNLTACMKDMVKIRVASKSGRPVAAILTLRYKNTLVYKYGCSDRRFSPLGGEPFLLWKAIQEASNNGLQELDLGRSDLNNPGLTTFKERLGAKRFPLGYWRYPQPKSVQGIVPRQALQRLAGVVLSHAPGPLLRATGRVLYPHIG